MKFEEAMKAMRNGDPVRRKGQEHFYFLNKRNRIVKAEAYWGTVFEYRGSVKFSNRDICAEDWEVVTE